MIPKNRIHLSRSLKAQTTPFPEALRWFKRGIWVITFGLILGIYLLARPAKHVNETVTVPDSSQDKQILGDQESATKPSFTIYKVKKGDTLFNLGQKYQVSWQTLAELNGLKEPSMLKIGQEIKIPQQTN